MLMMCANFEANPSAGNAFSKQHFARGCDHFPPNFFA